MTSKRYKIRESLKLHLVNEFKGKCNNVSFARWFNFDSSIFPMIIIHTEQEELDVLSEENNMYRRVLDIRVALLFVGDETNADKYITKLEESVLKWKTDDDCSVIIVRNDVDYLMESVKKIACVSVDLQVMYDTEMLINDDNYEDFNNIYLKERD